MSWQRTAGIASGIVSILAIVAALLAGGALYLEWRIADNVNNALEKMDLGTDAKIVSMDKDIQTNTTNIANNADNNERTQRQLEKVAEILMQPPD